jgi:23S rRNA maturation-related 3'-5' exoribonuclease YhaM
MIGRQTAYKIWISNLLNGTFTKQPGEWDPNYLECNGKKVSRVNIIGSVVSNFVAEDGKYAYLTIDDGSACIRIKTFADDNKLIEGFNRGNLVMLIGRVREYNNEIYLQPEIVKNLTNPNWELIRKSELFKEYGKFSKLNPVVIQAPQQQEQPQKPVEESVVSSPEKSSENNQATETLRQKILSKVEQAADAGAEIQSIIHELEISEEDANKAIDELLKEGEVYMARAGILKII